MPLNILPSERAIVEYVLKLGLAKPWVVTLNNHDGPTNCPPMCNNFACVYGNMFRQPEETIIWYSRRENGTHKRWGSITFCYGQGFDVIQDYQVSVEADGGLDMEALFNWIDQQEGLVN